MTRNMLALALAFPALFACDSMLSAFEPLTEVTQAVTAEDAATSEEIDGNADESDMVARECDGPRDGDGGPLFPPPPPEVEIAACAPPVADDVDLGRGGRPRGHLAPIYDEDESRDLNDEELASLQADAAAGCTARNASLLDEFDVDTDGLLSQSEWDSMREAKRALRDAEREALDTDGDGEISREEHEAAHAALIEAWDVDDNGDLDDAERAAMREDLQQLVRTGERLPPLPIFGAHHQGDRPPPPPPDGMPPPPDGE
jgi:hypothetical protein